MMIMIPDSNKKRKIVLLTITESCNLECIYCFEKSKSNKEMDLEVAKSILIYEINNIGEYDEIEFDLFGGEPTLRKQFIIDLVEWTNNQKFRKPYLFFIETNGTLLDLHFKSWLNNNKDKVCIGLSLDGSPETHNHNRCNSYDKIDIDFFIKNFPYQSVRMTIYPETISKLSNDIMHLHKLGFNEVVSTFANGVVWNFSNIKGVLERELEILIDYYIENPHLKVCSIFNLNIIGILNQNNKGGQWCGAGINMVSYSYDGKRFPCQTFQPNATGLKAQPITLEELNFSKITNFNDPDCKECLIESICPNCYGINYIERGDLFRRDKGLCEITKVRAIATCMLQTKKIILKSIDIEPNNLFQTIEAIELINNKLLI